MPRKPPTAKEIKAREAKAREVKKRNLRVISMLMAEMPQDQIAAEVGISQRQVRRIWTDYSKADKLNPRHQDPADYVREVIERLRVLRTVLASRLTDAENTSALVGIVRELRELMDRETNLRQEVGYLPRNLGDLQVKFDVEYVAKVLVEVLDKNLDVPDKVWEELSERFSEETGQALSMN